MAAGVRRGARERNSDVGVDPAEEPSREPVPEHALQQLVALIPRAQPVAVGEEDAPALERDRKGLVGEGNVQLAPQVVSDPEVVISADIRDRQSRPAQLPQLLEHADVALGHGVAVFEPEVEEISPHVEGRALGENGVEEPQQVALAGAIGVGGALPEVGVGDKIGASGLGHRASV